MEQQQAPHSWVKTKAKIILNYLRGNSFPLQWIIDCLDLTRLEYLNSSTLMLEFGKWDKLMQKFFSSNTECPFGSRAISGAMSYGSWFTRSGMREKLEFQGQPFFLSELSLMLYYTSYVYNVTTYGAVEDYHVAVESSLDALVKTKARSLVVTKTKGERRKPHSLFQALYSGDGKKRPKHPSDDSSMHLYVPAQFFFFHWISVKIDCSLFKLWTCMPEFFWISIIAPEKKAPLNSIILKNNRYVHRLYAMSILSLVTLVVHAEEGEAVVTNITQDNSGDLLGAAFPIPVEGGSRFDNLETLRLVNMRNVNVFPIADAFPNLREVHIEGNDSETVYSFVLELPRLTKLGQLVGLPDKVSLIDCPKIVNEDLAYVKVGKRCTSLTIGLPGITELPFCRNRTVPFFPMSSVSLRNCTNLNPEKIREFLENAHPLALEMERMTQFDAASLGETMMKLSQLQSCTFINMGIADFTSALNGKSLLKELHISDDSMDGTEGKTLSIPYRDLPSLEKQSGLLSDISESAAAKKRGEGGGSGGETVIPLSPETAAALKFEKFQKIVQESGITRRGTGEEEEDEDEDEGGNESEVRVVDGDGTAAQLKLHALIKYGPVLGAVPTTPGPGEQPSIEFPPWVSKEVWDSLSRENRYKWLRNMASWAAEIDSWLIGPNVEEGVMCTTRTGLLEHVTRSRITDSNGNIFCKFVWKPGPTGGGGVIGGDTDAETLSSYVVGIQKAAELRLTLSRLPRGQLDENGTPMAPGSTMHYLIDNDYGRKRNHGITITDLKRVSSTNTSGNIVYDDRKCGVKFVLCEYNAFLNDRVEFVFSLDSLIQFFALQMMADMFSERRARAFDVKKAGLDRDRIFGAPEKLQYEDTNETYRRIDRIMEHVLEMQQILKEEVSSPLAQTELMQLYVPNSPYRATHGNSLVHVYVMGLGIAYFLREKGLGNQLYREYIGRIMEKFLAPALEWIIQGEPVLVEYVETSMEESGTVLGEDGHPLSDMEKRFEKEILGPLYSFYQDENEETGVLFMFQFKIFDNILDLFVGAKDGYKLWADAGFPEDEYAEEFLIFLFFEHVTSFKNMLVQLNQTNKISENETLHGMIQYVISILDSVFKTFSLIQEPLKKLDVEFSKTLKEASVAKEFFKIYSLNQVADMMKDAYYQCEEVMYDKLPVIAKMLDDIRDSPHKDSQPSEQQLQSPLNLESKKKRQKLVKKKVTWADDEKGKEEEEEEDEILLLSEDSGVEVVLETSKEFVGKRTRKLFEQFEAEVRPATQLEGHGQQLFAKWVEEQSPERGMIEVTPTKSTPMKKRKEAKGSPEKTMEELMEENARLKRELQSRERKAFSPQKLSFEEEEKKEEQSFQFKSMPKDFEDKPLVRYFEPKPKEKEKEEEFDDESKSSTGPKEEEQQQQKQKQRGPVVIDLTGDDPIFLNCSVCNASSEDTTEFNRCSKCKSVYYCSRKCQVSDWNKHKKLCCCSKK